MAYLTADQLRDRVPALAEDEVAIPDEALVELVAEFEVIAEEYIGVAYEERETVESFDLTRTSIVVLKWPLVSSVDAITLDDETVDADCYTFTDGYSIRFPSPRTGVLAVEYTHGLPEPTAQILRACREYVRSCALADRSRTPRDAYLQQGDGITFRLSTPDWDDGRPTGYIEVDRILNTALKTSGYRIPGVG